MNKRNPNVYPGTYGLTWLGAQADSLTLHLASTPLHPTLLLCWSHSGFLSLPCLISQLKTYYCCSPPPWASHLQWSLDISFLHKPWDLLQCHPLNRKPLSHLHPQHIQPRLFQITMHITENASNDVPGTAQGTLYTNTESFLIFSYYVIIPTLRWKLRPREVFWGTFPQGHTAWNWKS